MGFFKKIGKGLKSIVKGVGKVFRSVGRVVKKVVGSKLGKFLLIAAAIWLGGAAIGMWNSGFAAIDGALVASGAGAATPAAAELATAAGGSAAAGSGATAGAAAGGAGAAGASPFLAQGAAGTTAGVGAGTAASPFGAAAAAPVAAGSPFAAPAVAAAPATTTVGASTGAGGFMSAAGKAVSGAAKWMEANPIPTLLGGQMLASAMTPDQIDLMEEERRLAEQARQAANARLEGVGGVNTWGYSGAQLPTPQITAPKVQLPQQQGLMGRRMVLPV